MSEIVGKPALASPRLPSVPKASAKPLRFDVLIAGGGPAGALAALLLRRQGLKVGLVDAARDGPRIEGLSARTLQVLTAQGLEEATAEASPPIRRRADWGSLSAKPNLEHLVERGRFDARLRSAARVAGVTLFTDRVHRLLPGEGLIAEQAGHLTACLVIDARGRRATVDRRRLLGPRSVAMAGFSDGDAQAHVSVTATPLGWVWRAASPGLGRWVQVVMDGATVSAGKAGLAAAWRAFFAQPQAGPAEALPRQAQVRSAELRLAAPTLDPRLPRLGDAAIAMDPLSGHGLFWALSSALSAVPLVHALLAGEEELAGRFYSDRLTETFWRQARIGRDFHRLVQDWPDAGYWSKRQVWPDDEPAHAEVAEPRISRRVVVRDGRLVEAEAVVTAAEPGGVAFVCGHEIAPLLRRLRRDPPADAESFHHRFLPDASPGEAAQILGWLKSRALLPWQATRTTKMEASR